MGRKPIGKTPKVQRGISLDPELIQAIQDDANRLGKRWNEIAESVLRKAFPVSRDLHPVGKTSHNEAESDPEVSLRNG